MQKIKKVFVWLLIIAIIAAIGLAVYEKKNKKTAYVVTPVKKGTLVRTISADGEYLSKDKANVSFRISGPVTGINFDVGDKVKKGQVIAKVDTGILKEQLKQAQGALFTQKQTLANMKRKSNAYKNEQENAQRGAIQNAQGAIDAILAQFPYAILKSPMDGTVVEKNVNLGEIAQAGNPVFTIIKEDEMRIEARVPEVEIANVKVGQETKVKFDAYPENRRFKAVVFEIEPAPVTIENVSYYIVKLHIEDPEEGFRYGMSCTVYDEVYQKEDVIMISKGTIEKENGKDFVAIMKDPKQNIVEKREVQLGLDGDDSMIEVVSGLKEGDQIAAEK